MSLRGIDISEWQKTINYAKVKQDGINFVIPRQGYRQTVDKYFFKNVEGIKANNILLPGVYHFAYALNKDQAIREAKSCIANIQKAGLGKDIIIFYDFQYDTVKSAKIHKINLGKSECITFTRAFCDYVISQGYKAGIYLNQDYYKNMYDKETLNKYIIWLADYNENKPPAFNCTYRQYSSKGKVAGISGNVDMNVFYDKQQQKEQKELSTVTAQDIIETMKSWIGKSRSAGTHKDIIDLYNSHKPLAQNYKVTYKDDYCDTTVSAAFIKNNAVDLIGGTECGVERHIQLFKKKGIWQEDGSVRPAPGWIITFNWDDGTQPNDGFADHIGIVEKVEGNIITTIEGNTNGGIVARRTLRIANGNIRGYAIPKYGIIQKNTTKEEKKKTLQEVALEIANETGLWGNGDYRKTALAAAGYNPTQVQNKVNQILNAKKVTPEKLIAKSKKIFTVSKGYSPSRTCKFKAKVNTKALYVRSWAGNERPKIKKIPIIYKGKEVEICDSIKDSKGLTWYYVRIDNEFYGFCNSKFFSIQN